MRDVLPDFVTPEQLANHFGWSPRKVREKIREIGAYRIMGNAVIMLKDDVDALMAATKPDPLPHAHIISDHGGYSELVKLRDRMKKERADRRGKETA